MSKNPVLNTYNFVSTSNRQLQLDSNHYELIIRQQPKQARLCSSKERDRRPVDPPPIIQLKVNGYGDEAQNFLQSPYYFMCANLVHPTDSGESFTVSSRYLAGTVVSSLHKLKDIDNKDGGFFVFGDISVRVEGRYRLRFSLFEIIRDEVVHIQSVVSDVFTVYSPKAFPGMSESTFLSRSFSDQGVRIRIRKEHRIQMKRPQSNNRQSDTTEYDDDNININDDGITDIPAKRKRSKSQIAQISTFKSTPPLELLDNTSMSYSQSQHSPYAPSSDSSYPSYQQYHKFRQGGGSLSYPPPLLGYPPHPPQRQNSYYEDHEYGPSSRDDHTSSSPYYYGEQYKRPRLSNSEVPPYDYRQSSIVTPLKDNQFTTTNHHHHHYTTSSPPPHPPPPSSSSLSPSSYRTSRRLSPLLEHQPSYVTSSTNNSSSHVFNHDHSLPNARHRSFDVLTSTASSNTTSLDSFHYSVTSPSPSSSSSSATTLQPVQPSEPFYQSSSSFTPKPPSRSRTLPLYSHNGINNNDNDNDNIHHHNYHHDSTASFSSSNQLPTPKTSIDVDVLHSLHHNHNKKQLYSSYPPLTPPNLNSSSVDSYKSGNNNSSNNLTPSFTQHFTSSPRPGPLQLPPKSPLSSNMRTNSLPIMSSNSSTSSSNSTTFLNNNEGVLTSSPLLLPTTNTDNLPKLPPITSLTSRIDFIMNKTKDNYYNDSVPQQQGQQYYHQSYSMDDNNLNYNNNVWHNNGGSSIDNGY
ncbi:uncharacterized protein OCT59_009568 [Rhizophagus irregularis]|uniref:Velvet domain-containing protein n=3 Tax=Rhizophagus irregularis TaxID=588596 RepID=A0A015KE16_RHIIW|nr:velvet factor-domain-containing protein [Rhizophagus irregularis DAOM 181602=DAOM 197198]EXX57826.1 hypothetical protein RirG_203500 [Rhizophagus irregularis DAOM 197198w]UZO18249.1 hypothetical protein OCT59_009568 [Rhizophagus irregularis]POG75977.1 velvet factor-domain-containing protein [Rhizophagus irregularis DAOM 181602=DAOM 197198]CAB4383316.1 unnamed protein product [Rhizophagus irregularis]CAB5355285.1 unnamed protein product [Rhizophagus irregularis]|eukprot:XP_025182843.1 velvet factor-domain-containing protein [Rhizophagus irregularis DAOM 181602=DAOM 197198]